MSKWFDEQFNSFSLLLWHRHLSAFCHTMSFHDLQVVGDVLRRLDLSLLSRNALKWRGCQILGRES